MLVTTADDMLTLEVFLPPAFPCGNGAGAAFFPFGAYDQTVTNNSSRLSLREG
jgi:hypothetical protein